jgi:hypothetical protein
MEEIKIGYMAGIIDGEGSVSLRRSNNNRRSFNPMIQVTNTNKEMLNWINANFSGAVYKHTWGHYGKHKNEKAAWLWQLKNHNDVEDFLKLIYPYLIIKKKQAELVLKYIDLHWHGNFNAKNTAYYPENLAKKELKIFLDLWKLNSRGMKARKPIIPDLSLFGYTKCKECELPIRIKKDNKKQEKDMCSNCNKKKYGYYWNKNLS